MRAVELRMGRVMGVPALFLLSERAVRTLYRWMRDVARASPARLFPPALVVLAMWWWMSIDVGCERQEQGAGRQRPPRLLPTVYPSEPRQSLTDLRHVSIMSTYLGIHKTVVTMYGLAVQILMIRNGIVANSTYCAKAFHCCLSETTTLPAFLTSEKCPHS